LSIRGISWLAIAGVAFVLPACGSGSSRPASEAAPAGSPQQAFADTAHARYIARSDQVCRAGNAAIAPVNARGAEIEAHSQDAARTAELLVPVLHEGLRDYRVFYLRLRRLPAPSQDRAAVASIMVGLRRVGNDLERLTAALEQGELEKVRAITSERDMDHARVSAQELEFGFKICGQPQGGQSSPSG
jgi:hypothetical protein